MAQRIQKYLANLGFASRRSIEQWIKEGRLFVNKQQATLGDHLTDDDTVYLDQKILKAPGCSSVPEQVLIYHKPLGQMCSTKDPHFKSYVTSHLPVIELGRWVMVGRLDVNTSGLLIFTTDGKLANHLMYPRYGVKRVYQVKVFGLLDAKKRTALLSPVALEDGQACFSACRILSSH